MMIPDLKEREQLINATKTFIGKFGIHSMKNRLALFSFLNECNLSNTEEYRLLTYNYTAGSINHIIKTVENKESFDYDFLIKQSVYSLEENGLNELQAYRALELFVASFDYLNNMDAMILDKIGEIYYESEQSNEEEFAVSYFCLSAQKGYGNGEFHLGICYFDGIGVDTDKTRGLFLIKKAAQSDNVMAQLKYAGCLMSDENGITDESIFWLRKAADNGEATAQYFLAYYLLIDDSLNQEGLQYMIKAADANIEDALMYLARYYTSENKQDVAIQYYKKAANLGVPDAQCVLGILMTKGQYVTYDFNNGMSLISDAANAGSMLAQEYYGDFIWNSGDYCEAKQWYQKAADQGSETAKEKLGKILF